MREERGSRPAGDTENEYDVQPGLNIAATGYRQVPYRILFSLKPFAL